MNTFTHLHVHTQFSILDGASNIPALVARTKEQGMNALAITDHGNMFGVKMFHEEAKKQEIKPIIGIESYVAKTSRHEKNDQNDRSGYHLILLAKNETGYKNLMKLSSFAFTEGHYYKPRIDRELLEKYHEGLIVSSACLGGEIPQKIMFDKPEAVEEAVNWYKNLFGDDFYLELQRHETGTEKDKEVYDNQVKVNKVLIELAKKHNIKLIATNDVHFINAKDAEAHDRLICLSTGKDLDDPKRMRYTKQEYLKSPDEMATLFADVPEAISNTQEIIDKIEDYELDKDPIMPDFPLPEEFENEDEYLRHITYEGAKERWGDITPEIKERLDFELETIKSMGFPGYFLIVWDFIKAAREMGVIVGPGRGSAAGSAVAYCTKIINIDPIKYNLLFERFLNPDRISMPDIDIDFDDDGREQVINWVVKKYGESKVAHIITFGTMAAKMAIRDVARIEKLPLPEADKLAKLVPEGPKVNLKKAFNEVPELEKEKKSNNQLVTNTLKFAEILEGSVRQSGVHACGIIIGRNDLWEDIPVTASKDTKLMITQYDGSYVESVGMLKMDFLGLKTLSIIKETLANIKISKGIEIDIENVPLDDKKTFELYAKGETTALFQFESDGMKKHLRALKPNRFEDLVAMNALYRPGPMQYIPSYIKRKHGDEKIVYDHPMMEPFLKETYGITVFQEQVMLQSRALAGFSRGQSDSLRKAMGKKKRKMMDELKVKFIEGCKANDEFIKGCEQMSKDPEKLIQKIWKDWEAFAKYAFNKSHSVCYANVSYQTAYLKAHYPAEFMAGVLSRNLSDIKKITLFMDECRRMGSKVLGPDVNESFMNFNVNLDGHIRFGLAAIKGVGESAARDIIDEREKNGHYKNIFDFVERVNLRSVNKRNIESLALAGAFDNFNGIKRHQFFSLNDSEHSFIEELVKYGNKFQYEKNTPQQNLFGEMSSIQIVKPEIPEGDEWSKLKLLNHEKELIGIYLSAHPLDDFKFEIESICNANLSSLTDLQAMKANKEIRVAGMITKVEHRTTKKGKPFGSITLEDFHSSFKFMLFSRDYSSFKNFMNEGSTLLIAGKVQERPYGDRELEFKINKIEYLAEVRDMYMKSLAIKISINDLNQEIIDEIKSLADENKGNADLKFLIWDPETKVWIQTFSRSNRIGLTDSVIDYLKNNPLLDYKVG